MSDLECILMIIINIGLGFLAVWLLDKYIAVCKEEFERRWREEERLETEESNSRWYAETRAQLDREQLFREYTKTK